MAGTKQKAIFAIKSQNNNHPLNLLIHSPNQAKPNAKPHPNMARHNKTIDKNLYVLLVFGTIPATSPNGFIVLIFCYEALVKPFFHLLFF